MKKIFLLIFTFITITFSLIGQNQCKQSKTQKKIVSKSSIKNIKYKVVSSEDKETIALPRSSLSKIKAVLVVGPTEDATQNSIKKVIEIATYLKSLGVNVKEFYDTTAIWANIVSASKGANIFLYSGHGTNMGEKEKTGGFCLSNREFVSSATIEKELKLHKNALVLFFTVCKAAGSSAGDDKDIGVKEAIQRVSDYAHPFIKIGASGYYANNWGKSMIPFLKAFFNKKIIKQIYIEATAKFSKLEVIQKYSYDPSYEVSVASFDNSGYTSNRTTYINGIKRVEKVALYKSYEIAFVGKPGFTVYDFLK